MDRNHRLERKYFAIGYALFSELSEMLLFSWHRRFKPLSFTASIYLISASRNMGLRARRLVNDPRQAQIDAALSTAW